MALLCTLLLVFETTAYWHARNVFDDAAAEGAIVAHHVVVVTAARALAVERADAQGQRVPHVPLDRPAEERRALVLRERDAAGLAGGIHGGC